jgi:DNA polymerase-1
MERTGVKLDETYLRDYATDLDKQIDGLRRQIVEFAGIEFNVNSPSSLGSVV